MYKLLCITLFITLLHAQSPKPFASLGNPIYENLEKIITLSSMKIYKAYAQDINKYIKDVKKIKKMGFALEAGSHKVQAKNYLKKLRDLSKRNKYFLESINNYYYIALQKSDTTLFSKIINSKLIDINGHKKEIYNYYKKHADTIEITPVLEKIIQNETKTIAKKAKRKKYKSQHARVKEKIKRMREHYKKTELALEKKLQAEVDRKKEAIRKEQRKELGEN